MKKFFSESNVWLFCIATITVLFLGMLNYLDTHKKVGHETLTVHSKHAVNLVMTCDKTASDMSKCTFAEDK